MSVCDNWYQSQPFLGWSPEIVHVPTPMNCYPYSLCTEFPTPSYQFQSQYSYPYIPVFSGVDTPTIYAPTENHHHLLNVEPCNTYVTTTVNQCEVFSSISESTVPAYQMFDESFDQVTQASQSIKEEFQFQMSEELREEILKKLAEMKEILSEYRKGESAEMEVGRVLNQKDKEEESDHSTQSEVKMFDESPKSVLVNKDDSFEVLSSEENDAATETIEEMSAVVKEEIVVVKVFDKESEQVLGTVKNFSKLTYHEEVAANNLHQLFDENRERDHEGTKLDAIAEVEPKPPDSTIQYEDELFYKSYKHVLVEKEVDPLEGAKTRKELEVFNEMTESKVFRLVESNSAVIREELPRITLLVEGSGTLQAELRYNLNLLYASMILIHDPGGLALRLLTCLGPNFNSNRQISFILCMDCFHYEMLAELSKLLVCCGKWDIEIYSFVLVSLGDGMYVIVGEILGNVMQLFEESLGNKMVKVLVWDMLFTECRRFGGMRRVVENGRKQGTEQLYMLQLKKMRANPMERLQVSAVSCREVAEVIDKMTSNDVTDFGSVNNLILYFQTSRQFNGSDYVSVRSDFSKWDIHLIGYESYKVVTRTSVSTAVAVYLDTITSINVFDDLCSKFTNFKHRAQVLYVLVSVYSGVARVVSGYSLLTPTTHQRNVDVLWDYASSGMFTRMREKTWIRLMIFTASLAGFILHTVTIIFGSLTVIPIGIMMVVYVNYDFISFPMVLPGIVMGNDWCSALNNLCRMKTTPHLSLGKKWNYKQQWASLLLDPSTVIYVELYPTYYFSFKTRMSEFSLTSFCLGYTMRFCFELKILCGKQFVNAAEFCEKMPRLCHRKALINELVNVVEFNGSFLVQVYILVDNLMSGDGAGTCSSMFTPHLSKIIYGLIATADRIDGGDSKYRSSTLDTLNGLPGATELPTETIGDWEKQEDSCASLCGALQVNIKRVDGVNETKPVELWIADMKMMIFGGCSSPLQEKAMLNIDAQTCAIGPEFLKAELYKYLEMDLQKDEEYCQICSISVSALGDTYRALDDKLIQNLRFEEFNSKGIEPVEKWLRNAKMDESIDHNVVLAEGSGTGKKGAPAEVRKQFLQCTLEVQKHFNKIYSMLKCSTRMGMQTNVSAQLSQVVSLCGWWDYFHITFLGQI